MCESVKLHTVWCGTIWSGLLVEIFMFAMKFLFKILRAEIGKERWLKYGVKRVELSTLPSTIKECLSATWKRTVVLKEKKINSTFSPFNQNKNIYFQSFCLIIFKPNDRNFNWIFSKDTFFLPICSSSSKVTPLYISRIKIILSLICCSRKLNNSTQQKSHLICSDRTRFFVDLSTWPPAGKIPSGEKI